MTVITLGDIVSSLTATGVTFPNDFKNIILSTDVPPDLDVHDSFTLHSDTVQNLTRLSELSNYQLDELGLPFKQVRVAVMSTHSTVDLNYPTASDIFFAEVLFKVTAYHPEQRKVTVNVIRSKTSIVGELTIDV